MSIILATREAEIRKNVVGGQPRKIVYEALPRKCPTQKRAGEVTQVVECLLSKCNALISSTQCHQINKQNPH
jgi:hypothetical protein